MRNKSSSTKAPLSLTTSLVFCGTPFGSLGVWSRKDRKLYYSETGRISVTYFAPRLDFFVNTVEDEAIFKESSSDEHSEAEPHLGFVFSQVFNYLDCTSPELSCGLNSIREVAQVRLQGAWRNARGTPPLRRDVVFGPNQQEDWQSLLTIFESPYETLLDYYKDAAVSEFGYRARIHGEVSPVGWFASEAVATSAETFTRWWVPADCLVTETEHCSHTALSFRVTTSTDDKVVSPTKFNVSPWFTKKIVVWSWTPFNYEDNLLVVTQK